MEVVQGSESLENIKMDAEEPSTSGECASMDVDVEGKPISQYKKVEYNWTDQVIEHLKVAVIGANNIGKTALVLSATDQILPHPQEKFAYRHHPYELELDGEKQECLVADLDPRDELKAYRKQVYKTTDAVLLCFSEPDRLEEVENKWQEELKEHNLIQSYIPVKIIREGERNFDIMEVDATGFVEWQLYSPPKKAQDLLREACRLAKRNGLRSKE